MPRPPPRRAPPPGIHRARRARRAGRRVRRRARPARPTARRANGVRACAQPRPRPQLESSSAHSPLQLLPPHAPRRPRRRRGRQPPPARARRATSAGRPRRVRVAADRPARQAKIEEVIREEMDRGGCARGALPGAAATRALRGHQSLDRVRRRPLPPEGPQGRRLPAGADARGGLHAAGEGPVLLLQGPAAHDLPDPGQVPRRGAPPRRPPPRPRVHHEGRVLVRLRPTRVSTRATRRSATRTSASSTRLGLEYVIVKADAGAMGGSKSEEFLHPTPVGEDTFVRSARRLRRERRGVSRRPRPSRSRSTACPRRSCSTRRTRRRSPRSSTSRTREHPRADGRSGRPPTR